MGLVFLWGGFFNFISSKNNWNIFILRKTRFAYLMLKLVCGQIGKTLM